MFGRADKKRSENTLGFLVLAAARKMQHHGSRAVFSPRGGTRRPPAPAHRIRKIYLPAMPGNRRMPAVCPSSPRAVRRMGRTVGGRKKRNSAHGKPDARRLIQFTTFRQCETVPKKPAGVRQYRLSRDVKFAHGPRRRKCRRGPFATDVPALPELLCAPALSPPADP